MLPGFATIETGKVTGYVFCVYEETKAVIGDVFARQDAAEDGGRTSGAALEREETLLRHLFELLLNSPHVDRIESQLLLHPSGRFAAAFRAAGFHVFRRLFLVQTLAGRPGGSRMGFHAQFDFRSWRDIDLSPAAQLICEAYRDHPDSAINDQYRTAQGSLRFLNNIVRHAGCGAFVPQASFVLLDRASQELAALVLSSRVSELSGHITQVCVHPAFRRRGLARFLLDQAAGSFARLGAAEISLTVTEANQEAIQLYRAEGYQCTHSFDASIWRRASTA